MIHKLYSVTLVLPMTSAEEKVKIASHFILSAPHGELREVVAGVLLFLNE